MGLFGSIFGKKVVLEGRDEAGNPYKKKVSESQLEQWEKQGKIEKLEAVTVHMLDPNGSYTTDWIVGKDIPVDIAEKARNPETNDLYAITVYREGRPETSVVVYDTWLKMKAAMDAVG